MKKKRVIPGFGLSMGVTLSMLSIVVLIPLASLVVFTAQMEWKDILSTITRGRVLSYFLCKLSYGFCVITDQCCDGTGAGVGADKI